MSGPSVDRINEVKPNFEKVVVGQITKIKPHPNADKLHVCQVNVGQEELSIVCGASNIKEGQKVPVVLVGGRVGDWQIKEAKLRGVDSYGMMCSQKELGISDNHSGIFILPDYTEIGLPLEKVMPIEDAILDIEVTSNRPDAMSVVGLAREAAAILNEKFLYHEPKPNLNIKSKHNYSLKVKVQEPKLCPRYSAIVMSEVKVEASPLWMQQRLLASGLRPINNLVDITNYVLLEFGQPMHVFDYEKLQGSEINIRLAKNGEKILALDGKEYNLSDGQLVIADNTTPVAVAGIMGGELSAATETTKTIVFECANFDPVSIRKTSRILNLRSESSALYEKGLSPENVTAAMLRAIELAQELAGAKVASKLIDEKNYKEQNKEIILKWEKVNQALGIKIKLEEIKNSLTALGFTVVINKSSKEGVVLKVAVPWWRINDIEGQHDLIEEIARMYGYYNLPANLMAGELPKATRSKNYEIEEKIKDILVGFGLTEVYSYSFISEKQIKACGLNPAEHIKIFNPLSIDFEYLRTSLLPSILQIISENQGFYPNKKIFELSKIYLPLGSNDLANEPLKLLIAGYGAEVNIVSDEVKGVADGLFQRLNINNVVFNNANNGADIIVDNKKIGEIKIIDNKILTTFGIKRAVVIVDLDFLSLAQLYQTVSSYNPIPKFPAVELDLSMEIDNVVTFAEVTNLVYDTGAPVVEKVDFLSVYQGEKIPEGKKALAIRIIYRDLNKTLELIEAQSIHEKIIEALKTAYNIKLR